MSILLIAIIPIPPPTEMAAVCIILANMLVLTTFFLFSFPHARPVCSPIFPGVVFPKAIARKVITMSSLNEQSLFLLLNIVQRNDSSNIFTIIRSITNSMTPDSSLYHTRDSYTSSHFVITLYRKKMRQQVVKMIVAMVVIFLCLLPMFISVQKK